MNFNVELKLISLDFYLKIKINQAQKVCFSTNHEKRSLRLALTQLTSSQAAEAAAEEFKTGKHLDIPRYLDPLSNCIN